MLEIYGNSPGMRVNTGYINSTRGPSSVFTLYLHACQVRVTLGKDEPQVEFMYLVFTRMPMRVTAGNLGLCCLCYVFQGATRRSILSKNHSRM